ncbi:hypothetical protein [Acidithiobacillus albertensis]|uniref:hypothetical protein n=1 Tax=Acidithiobacillus albertensis TaxID=119978 RepID=UPI001C06CABA|nr:hypothetical protein [Acidithiobacillus albertensis]MBU2741281.1 hypothetical protein [Acidithiobacillus albertensis]
MNAQRKTGGGNPPAAQHRTIEAHSTSIKARRAIAKAAHQYRLQQAQALIDWFLLLEGSDAE